MFEFSSFGKDLGVAGRATILATVFLLASSIGSLARSASIDFQGSSWIWYPFGPGVTIQSFPAGVTFFRGAVDLPDGADVASAEVIVTVDNAFALYLNGDGVGESGTDNGAWARPKRYDVTKLLLPGRNVLAVEAVNTLPGPAAMLLNMEAELQDGRRVSFTSDATWKCSNQERLNWQKPEFDDEHWLPAQVLGAYGVSPWRNVLPRSPAESAGGPIGEVHLLGKRVLRRAAQSGWTASVVEASPEKEEPWPEAVIFVGDDCSLYRPSGSTRSALDSLSVTIFNPRKSRSFPEHDLPAPMKVGHKLFVLEPARPGVTPRLLLDAGLGAIGSPSVSFDGRSILFSMVGEGESFFRIYRLPAEGGRPTRLTSGPFHDIDPVELPDGRVAFTSTRIGTFEEYHNPPSRALFVMEADGTDIRPLTHTIVFDNEPEVLADGRILFVRSDNFFDRGKVETLLHAVYPDGTRGQTEFGIENGPEYGNRLRAFLCGSPAPMPDGRVAFVSGPGITVGRPGSTEGSLRHFRLAAGDVAALPDGRLLCTVASQVPLEVGKGSAKRTVQELSYRKICILDTRRRPPTVTIVHEAQAGALHSPVYLGVRERPPALSRSTYRERVDVPPATGFLFCQDVRATKNTTAGWSHVRAIRVLAAKGLTTRSSHSYIVHAGNETVELGTVPLAPDGSFFIEVPANTPLSLQAVDAEGRAELNEMSWIYVGPGERRGCVGCHQSRQAVPPRAGASLLALRAPPLRLLGKGRPHRFRGNNAAVTGLMELQFDRYREVAGIDRHDLEADPVGTGSQVVQSLTAQLRSSDPELRTSAAQRLSVFRAPAAANALVECLDASDRETRVAAAMALATCGTRESVNPLLDALATPDPVVAQAAAVAIENLTGHAEPFNPFVTRRERYRQARNWSLWFERTGWSEIESALVRRLESSNRDVVRRSAVALGHIGGDAARAALRRYVTRERENNPLPAWRAGGHRGDNARFDSQSAVNPRTLQAATRSLGYLGDAESVPLLSDTLRRHSDPQTANLFLAEAAVEALGRIGKPRAEDALINGFARLGAYPRYTYWYGDHEALMACHASPVHYFIAEALDHMGSTRARSILPKLIRSVPIDTDRALLLSNDDCETLIGRIIRRNGAEGEVVETCLAILGDRDATRVTEIEAAVRETHRAWGGHPDPENRAAQILSLVCRDKQYEPRVRAAFDRYRMKPTTIPRVFDHGIPVVRELPAKHWVCFFLARAMGTLADERSVGTLITALEEEPTEAATGRPDPLGPGVLFLHNDLTPCWRAAVAWALGRIGDPRAVETLIAVVADIENATDTRHAAAEALGRIPAPSHLEAIRELATDYPEVSTRRALIEAYRSLQDS